MSGDPVTQLGPDKGALGVLSLDQVVVFVKYIRHVLPLDGYIFWLRTEQTSVQGALHTAPTKRQNEDETIAVNQVIFTTATEVQAFNDIDPGAMWVGEFEDIRFAFSRQGAFFRAAGLYHYVGDAVYPVMETQLVDVGDELSERTLIVSNSLPAWLTLQSYTPIWLTPSNPDVTLYPSFAVPDNLRPPYGVVHIAPEGTIALQGEPLLYRRATHRQLAADRVRITLYGLTNDMAQDFVDLVNSYSRDTNVIGMMNMPIVRDEKRTQTELNILAMKKTIDYEVSYTQTRINDIARQMVEDVSVRYFLQ